MPANIKLTNALRIIKVGNSAGLVLPKELLAKLGVELGDTIEWVENPDGFTIRKHDQGFAEQMAVAREVMKRRRNALRELAK